MQDVTVSVATSPTGRLDGAAQLPPARQGLISRLKQSPVALAGVALVSFWIAMAIAAPWVSPYSPYASDIGSLADPTPGAAHWLGTDQSGRDVLSRIIWGARTVLTVAPAAVVAAYVAGCLIGLCAGYFGGWIDAVLMRAADVIMAFPPIIVFIMLIMTIGPSAINVVVAVVIGSAPQIARLVRGTTLDIKTQDYVAAAQVRGEKAFYIMFAEILPNMRQLLIADGCMRFGFTIVAIGVLGFLGLGLPPPTPDWGGMVKDGTKVLTIWPHVAAFPALALISLVVGFNLLADGLREGLPR